MGYAENWPESYQPVNCLTFSLQLFFGPRNRRSSSNSRRKDKKQKAQKEGKCRARATEKEKGEGKPCKYAEVEFLVETEDSNDSQSAAGTEGGGVQGKREWGPMGSVIKCLQFYFSSFALSNLNDKWRRHRLQTKRDGREGRGRGNECSMPLLVLQL